MARFSGKIGFVTTSETSPDVWTETVTERNYMGDVSRNVWTNQNSGNVNDNLNLSNTISIVADSFAYENFSHMRYVKYMGAKWNISSAEVQRPRIILTIGGVYNG